PMLVTWPFLMLLLDYWPLERVTGIEAKMERGAKLRAAAWFPLVLEKVPFFALSAGSCIITFLVQKSSGAVVPLSATPVAARVANAIASYGRYLAKTFWPSKLAVFYPYELLSWDSAEVLVAAVLIALVTAAAIWGWKRKPYLPVGWFWFVGVLVP